MKLRCKFIIQEVGNRYLAVPVGNGSAQYQTALLLDETGAFMMDMLIKGKSRDDMLTELMNEYDADAETLSLGIDAFLASLKQRGAI